MRLTPFGFSGPIRDCVAYFMGGTTAGVALGYQDNKATVRFLTEGVSADLPIATLRLKIVMARKKIESRLN